MNCRDVKWPHPPKGNLSFVFTGFFVVGEVQNLSGSRCMIGGFGSDWFAKTLLAWALHVCFEPWKFWFRVQGQTLDACKCFYALQDSGSAMRGLEPSLLAPSFDLVLNAGQPMDAQALKPTFAWVGVTFTNLQVYTAWTRHYSDESSLDNLSTVVVKRWVTVIARPWRPAMSWWLLGDAWSQ